MWRACVKICAFPSSLELTKGLKSFDPQKDFMCDNYNMLPGLIIEISQERECSVSFCFVDFKFLNV